MNIKIGNSIIMKGSVLQIGKQFIRIPEDKTCCIKNYIFEDDEELQTGEIFFINRMSYKLILENCKIY